MTDTFQMPFRPDFVPPPGATLAELLEERGLTQAQLAAQMARPRKTINEIVKGKARIEAKTALELEHVLGLPAEFWSRREADYQAFCARRDETRRLARSLAWLKKLPVKEMMARGWIAPTTDRVEQLRRCLDFFRVSRPEQLGDLELAGGVSFRSAPHFASDPFALTAWLRRGELLVEQQAATLPVYRSEAFRAVVDRARALTREPLSASADKLRSQCAACGVVVLFVPELPKTRVCGATRWVADHPVIQLSLRYKTDDQLWFTFFHEAGHVLLHARGAAYVDEERRASSADDAKESEANRFASSLLVPEEALASFVTKPRFNSKASIAAFAAQIGIAPGIVVGQLHHRRHLPYTHCNDLKVRISDELAAQIAS